MDAREAARRWASTWKNAWEAKDTEAIVAALCRRCRLLDATVPHAHLRRAGVREYVSQAFAEEDGAAGLGRGPRSSTAIAPRSNGGRPLTENGVETTLAGTSVLRFDDDGLVVEQRDTWNQADGRREPPDSWGR